MWEQEAIPRPRCAGAQSRRARILMGRAFSVNKTYLDWVLENTPTKWWHDSAATAELDLGLHRGAIGATTNPFLSNIALRTDRELWASEIDAILARNLPPEQKAE